MVGRLGDGVPPTDLVGDERRGYFCRGGETTEGGERGEGTLPVLLMVLAVVGVVPVRLESSRVDLAKGLVEDGEVEVLMGGGRRVVVDADLTVAAGG